MMQVNSNYGRTYSTLYTIWYNKLYYTDFWMGGYLRSEYYTFCGEKFLLVFTSGDETCSSMVIQVHQDIGDTGYIQIQVTQSKYIITRQKHGIVKAECYVGWHRGVYTFPHTYLSQAFIKPPVTYPAQWYVSTVQIIAQDVMWHNTVRSKIHCWSTAW